jgi:hypothetical protein
MTLSECRNLKLEAGDLAQAAWETLRAVCLRESAIEERAKALAALEGAERERQILAKMELELIGGGRLIESDDEKPALEAAQVALGPVITAESLPGASEPHAKAREGALDDLPQTPDEA